MESYPWLATTTHLWTEAVQIAEGVSVLVAQKYNWSCNIFIYFHDCEDASSYHDEYPILAVKSEQAQMWKIYIFIYTQRKGAFLR